MRMFGFLFATLLFACLNPAYVYAQDSEEQIEPYRKHRDTRHGHDHVYPDRGAIFRNLPRGAFVVNYAGLSYRFSDGVWFEPRGPAFMVVEPPIGVIVPTLPSFATWVAHGKGEYLYVNGVFYEPRPELGGYEVVNDPGEAMPFDKAGVTVATSPSAASPTAAAPQTSAALLATPAAVVGPVAAGTVVPASATGTAPGTSAAASLAGSTAAVPVPTPAASSLAASGSGTIPTSTSAPGQVPATSAAGAAAVPVTAASFAGSTAAPPIQAASLATLPAAAPTPPSAGSSPSAGPPPPPAAPQVGAPAPQMGSKVFVYPRNAQTADQQARDRYECYRFAVAQSGFDPMHSSSAATQAARAEPMSDYDRAQAACLEGHGYTVR